MKMFPQSNYQFNEDLSSQENNPILPFVLEQITKRMKIYGRDILKSILVDLLGCYNSSSDLQHFRNQKNLMTILRSEVLKKIHCLAEKSIYNHTSHGPLKWGTKYKIRFTPSEATYLKGFTLSQEDTLHRME